MIGRLRDVAEAMPSGGFEASITGDGFLIKTVRQGSAHYTVVAGTERIVASFTAFCAAV